MERDRLLIQADDGFGSIVRLLIHFQNVFHLFDVLGVELRNGRGRDAGHPAPPAQIPTGGITA
jgi:hypothetical protein